MSFRVDAPNDFIPLIVTSPSGGGKTTLVRRLLGAFSDLVVSVSYTTRAPRPGEEDGRDYHFVTPEVFDDMHRAGLFAESALVHGHRYGTSLARVDEARATHRGMIFVIDYQGARQVRAKIPDAVGVFVLAPSLAVLEARLRNRGTDSDATIAKRMANARTELQHYGLFDYVVVNDDLDRASQELESIVRAERSKRWRRAGMAEAVLAGAEVQRR